MLPSDLETIYKSSRVLITGGLGFIGSTLARRLVDLGATVTVVDSLIPEYGGNWFNLSGYENLIRVNVSDVRDRYSLDHLIKGQNYLFNLAGQTSHSDSMTSPEIDLAINCTAQLSILECCRKVNRDIRIVFASTRQIYGRPQYLPVDEVHPLVPVDVNGINKQAGESYHRLYCDVYGIRTTCLRLTNTYGPRMRIKDARQTFLGVWLRRIIESQPFEVYGTGDQLRDFNYVDDCVEALLAAGSNDALIGGIFNLGSAEVISLKGLATLLSELALGCEFTIVPFPAERKAIDIGDYFGKFDRFSSLTGWQPRISLRDGLQRSLDFYRENAVQYGINQHD